MLILLKKISFLLEIQNQNSSCIPYFWLQKILLFYIIKLYFNFIFQNLNKNNKFQKWTSAIVNSLIYKYRREIPECIGDFCISKWYCVRDH